MHCTVVFKFVAVDDYCISAVCSSGAAQPVRFGTALCECVQYSTGNNTFEERRKSAVRLNTILDLYSAV